MPDPHVPPGRRRRVALRTSVPVALLILALLPCARAESEGDWDRIFPSKGFGGSMTRRVSLGGERPRWTATFRDGAALTIAARANAGPRTALDRLFQIKAAKRQGGGTAHHVRIAPWPHPDATGFTATTTRRSPSEAAAVWQATEVWVAAGRHVLEGRIDAHRVGGREANEARIGLLHEALRRIVDRIATPTPGSGPPAHPPSTSFALDLTGVEEGPLAGRHGWAGSASVCVEAHAGRGPSLVLGRPGSDRGHLARRVDLTGADVAVLAFCAFAPEGPPSARGAAAGLGFSASRSAAPRQLGWTLDPDRGWVFDARFGRDAPQDVVPVAGGRTRPAHLEVLVDRRRNEAWGRYDFGGGLRGETRRIRQPAREIAALDEIQILDVEAAPGGPVVALYDVALRKYVGDAIDEATRTYVRLREDFDAIDPGLLAGRAGWEGERGIVVADAGGCLAGRAIDGHRRGASQRVEVSRPIDVRGVARAILSFCACGARRHGERASDDAGVGFQAGEAPETDRIAWRAVRGRGWRFDAGRAEAPGPRAVDVVGGMDREVRFEIEVDFVQGSAVGRYDFGNGERGETPRFALTASQLASIDAICVFMDWQTRDRTGIRVDDVVLRVQPSFPSDD